MKPPWHTHDHRKHRDFFGSVHEHHLGSNFQHDLLMPNYSSFGAFRQEKHYTVKMNVVPLQSQKLLPKKIFFVKNGHFLVFALWSPNRWPLVESEHIPERKSVKRVIECAFPRRCSSSGFRVMCQFVEKCWKRQNLTFGDLWWPDLKNIAAVSWWFLALFRMPVTACRYMAQEPI